ncbi:hypothetical protein SteCoe_5539 [Stentor coeruleus]|uniref:Uncharacterized protein n=1 Tax=Stentor coeruleus TaxID=5963 RepID=A0A1R2CS76_9CILI|nr:hypothetical protein SteCoe_5539 [Stentor coeruleus]
MNNYIEKVSNDQQEIKSSLLALNFKLHKWKKSTFSLLASLYHYNFSENPSSFNIIFFYFQNFIVLIQVASIIWTNNLSIKGWNDYKTLWEIFEYSRLDVLCVKADFIQNCIYGTYSFYFCLIFMLIILFVLSALMKITQGKLIYITGKLLIIAGIGKNSLCLIMVMTFKSSWQSTTPSEYNEIAPFDQGNLGICMSFLSIAALIFVGYCNTAFTYDCKHATSTFSLHAKSSSIASKVSFLANCISILIYCFISSNNPLIYRGLLIIIHSTSAGMYYYYLPFYNKKANFIHSSIHVFVVLSCFFNIIGYYIDSTVFCLLGLLILFPMLITLWYLAINYRIIKIKNNQAIISENITYFELAIREKLLNPKLETINKTFEMFNDYLENYGENKPKIIAVWFASFYFYTCKNEKLAIIKLNSKSISKGSFEEEFQEYILRKEIMKTLSQSQEYVLLTKLRKFEKLRKLDKKTLISAFTFLKNIVLKGPIQSNLEDLMKTFKKNLKKLMLLNTKLSMQYQDSIMILNFFANFVDYILGDQEKAFYLNSRKNNLNKYQNFKDGKQNLVFSEENPMILVENTGKIIYSNIHIKNLIKSSNDYFSELYINSLFPESLHFFSHEQLKSFENKTLDSTIYLDANIGLIDSKGYWIEASVVALLVSLSHPVYMFIFRPLNIQNHSIIVDKKGIILERTEGVDEFIGDNMDVRGFGIENILNISLDDLKKLKNIESYTKNSVIYATYNKIKVNNTSMRIVILYKNEGSYKESIYEINVKFDKSVEYKQKAKKNSRLENNNPSGNNEETLLFDTKLENDKSSSFSDFTVPMKKINVLSNQCRRSIKFLKITLIISVIFIQIIIVILSNIAFLIFAKFTIEEELSQKSLEILGETLYLITSLGDISSMIQSFIPVNQEAIPPSMIFFNHSLSQIKNLTHYYEHNTNTWSYCFDSNIFFSSIIPISSVKNNTYSYSYMTMYNFLLETIKKSEHFTKEITAKTYDINEDVLFLEFNAFGKASKYINNQLNTIVVCEKHNIKKLVETKKILIGFGIGILAICSIILLPFILYTQRKMNLMWNQVKKAAIEDSITFKKLCVERLESTHNSLNYTIGITTQNQKDRVVYFSYQYKYLWRLFLLAILGSCYYLISNYYFYDNFQFILDKKPEFIYNLIMARTRIPTLNFLIKNYDLNQLNLDPQFMSPNFAPLSTDYTSILLEVSDELARNLKIIIQPEFEKLRSDSFYKTLFRQVQNCTGIMRTGIYAGVLNTIIETFYIGYSIDYRHIVDFTIFNIIGNYYANIVKIGNEIEDNLVEAQKWIKTIVFIYLDMYLMFAVVFSGILLIIYAVVYYPFLYAQEKNVSTLEYVASIFISSNTSNSNKTTSVISRANN